MFARRLANLFKAFVVTDAAAHSIEILWNHRVIVVWQSKPVQVHGPSIAGVCSHRQTHPGAGAPKLRQPGEVPNDDVRAGSSSDVRLPQRWQCRRFHFAINQLADLDRLHRSADRDFSNYHTGVSWPAPPL